MKERNVLALGFFDGVHAGHAALLRTCRDMAADLQCRAGAVTFTDHPDGLVLGRTPGLINTLEDRIRLLRGLGMDEVLPLPFDREMMDMPWQDFFRLLVEKHRAAGLVCGHDFRFGAGGRGNAATLAAACREAGIPWAVVPEQRIGDIPVSSTYIRGLLERGEMARAVEFLGHPHVLTGTVIPGRGLGRTLGLPTANLALPEELVCPRRGVYVCRARAAGEVHPAVTNIGVRPTVGGGDLTVESWLPGYLGDLYGREMTLEFYTFLRPERRFPSVEALGAEVRKNGAQAVEYFKGKK